MEMLSPNEKMTTQGAKEIEYVCGERGREKNAIFEKRIMHVMKKNDVSILLFMVDAIIFLHDNCVCRTKLKYTSCEYPNDFFSSSVRHDRFARPILRHLHSGN